MFPHSINMYGEFALADYVKDIKVATSLWLKKSDDFPEFQGWEEGYSAFTYSYKEKDILINYIKNQQKHHQQESMQDEQIRLLKEYGIEPDR